jgi:hypothetical protein
MYLDKSAKMSILLASVIYVFSSVFVFSEIEHNSFAVEMSHMTDYDYSKYRTKTITWNMDHQVTSIEKLDEKLFDESVTPPITQYVGCVKPIFKNKNTHIMQLHEKETSS